MRRLFAALLLLALLAGCEGEGLPPESSASSLSGEGLVMAMEHPVYDPSVTSCIYLIRNGTEEPVDFGESYHLQRWEKGRWQSPEEEVCFTAIGYCLAPGETMALSCWLGGAGEAGDYRLVKEVGGETLYARFRLGESLYTAKTPCGFVPLEELDQVPDIQGPVSPEGEPGDWAEFVWKAGLDIPCQLRLVQGDGEVADIVYSNCHFLLRRLAEGEVTQTRFSYLVTDGRNLLLSNRAEWEPGDEAAEIFPEAGPELTQAVREITAARLEENMTRFRVWSEDGVWDAGLSDAPTEFSVGWQKPGEGSWGKVFNLKHWGGTETAILRLSWQEDNTLLLTCRTSSGGTSLLVFHPRSEQIQKPAGI